MNIYINISLPKLNLSVVTVLIGSEHPELLLHQEFKIGKPEDPVAVKTKLGWILWEGTTTGYQITVQLLMKRYYLKKIRKNLANRYIWHPC